jgi:hypothetical protein
LCGGQSIRDELQGNLRPLRDLSCQGDLSLAIEMVHSVTMISNEPEADADGFDDDQVLQAYLGIDAQSPAQDTAGPAEMPDWPLPCVRDIGLSIDVETVAWFKSRHADWRAEMSFVLRAWTIARSPARITQP